MDEEFEVRIEVNPAQVVVEPEQVTVSVQAEPPAVQIIYGIQGPPGGGGSDFNWLLIDSNFTMQAGIAYIVQSNSLVLLRLPAMATRGDRLVVYRAGSANWRITQGIGQTIKFGDRNTTVSNGSVESTADGDFVFLVALDSNTWLVYGSQGHLLMQ